jgi:hypothetical protein
MDEQQRVTFRFGGDTERYYMRELPSPGDRVTHQHEMWVVTTVGEDSLGALVNCERPRGEAIEEGDLVWKDGVQYRVVSTASKGNGRPTSATV